MQSELEEVDAVKVPVEIMSCKDDSAISGPYSGYIQDSVATIVNNDGTVVYETTHELA
jgi:hypothetical protein